MAGNNYKILLGTELDIKSGLAKAKLEAARESVKINLKFEVGDDGKVIADIDGIQKRFEEIRKTTDSMASMTAKKNPLGVVDQYTLNYIDQFKNKYSEIYKLVSKPVTKTIFDPETNKTKQITEMVQEWQKVEKVTDGVQARQKELERTQKEYNKSIQQTEKLRAKELDEMERAAKQADLFLAKSKNLAGTPSVQAAVSKANELKVAVSEGDIAKVRRLKDELDLAKAALQTGRTGLDSWSEGLRNSIKQTIEYATSIGLVYGALSQLKQGIQYLSDLDKEMTAIQLVTGYTDDQVGNLSLQFNDLAKNLGATTLEVAKGSTEWFRQGKTIEETSQLMESSMMMSKLANMESAQATEYLTSIINGFKLEAKDTQDVISKLIALDNAFATSTAEIASAMQRSSVSAQQAGVSMEELASMITVVSDVSRRAPESIGESFKTMFARYQDILAGQVDEDGMGINNVGKALERVGISIRDVDGGFRDFSDILDELYPKWNDLNEVEQANITKALAGVRQREALLILLENESKYRQALTETMDAEGLAADRYATYLDSVEAAQNRLTASWEELWMTTMNSDLIKIFYNLSSSLLESISTIGGLIPLLTTLGLAYLSFSGYITTSTIAMATSTLTANGLAFAIYDLAIAIETALATNPVGWAILLTGAIVMIANAIPTTQERLDSLNESFKSITDEIKSITNEQESLRNLAKEYKNLSEKERLSANEKKRLVDIQNELKEVMPSLIGYYDEYGNFIVQDTNAMKELSEATGLQIEAQEKLNQLQKEADASSAKRAGLLQSLYTESKSEYQSLGAVKVLKTPEQIKKDVEAYKEALEKEKGTFQLMGKEAQQAYIEGIQSPELREVFIKFQEELFSARTGDAYSARMSGLASLYTDAAEQGKESYAGFIDTIAHLNSEFENLNSLMEKSITGELSFEDISKIPEDYLDALTVENGQLRLNIDLIKQKQIAEAEAAYQAAVNAGESEQYINVLKLYYEQLQESQFVSIDGMKITQGAFDELSWSIAQQAAMSGNSFVDMQGKALNSVEAIYKYLTSGDQYFNDFVRQAAVATGKTTQDVMNIIQGMTYQVYNNTARMINNLGRAMGAYAARYSGLAGLYGQQPSYGNLPDMELFEPAPVGYQYPGGLSDYNSSGGSGNSELEHQREIEEQIREIERQIEESRKDAVDDLKDQLDVYKDIVDERKKLLDTLADEREYQQDVEDKNREILRIQNELSTLQLDTSQEAQARRLQLEEELANLTRELENIHYDQSVETQKNALDAEYANMEKVINDAIKQIEGIQASSLSDFASKLAQVLSQVPAMTNIPTYHTGVEQGAVGSNSFKLKSNEIFAKLLRGELVSTPEQADNFVSNVLPQIASATPSVSSGDVSISMPINVAGSLDKSVIPDLNRLTDKVLERIQEVMYKRGYNRRADAYQL